MSHIYIVSPTESLATKRGDRHPTLAKYLVENGHAVTYVTSDFSHSDKTILSAEALSEMTRVAPYKIDIIKTSGYQSNVSLARLRWNIYVALAVVRRLRNRITHNDVLLIPSRPPEMLVAAHILKRRTGCKVVVDIRDVWPEGLPLGDNIKSKMFASYCRLIYRRWLRGMDGYAHTAPVFLDWLEAYAGHRNSVFVPLGFDEQRWETATPLVPGATSCPIELLFVGNMTASMDVSSLLKRPTGNGRYRFTFVGGGNGLDAVRAHLKIPNVDNIEMLGFLSRDRVVAELRKRHISVIPMRSHIVFPNKLFDALGACRPLLVLGDNDAGRFVSEHGIGWNLPFDAATVGEFLDNLTIEDICVKSKNISKIRKSFSRKQVYRNLIELIEGSSQVN